LKPNCPGMIIGRSSVFYADRKSKMAATTGHSINTEPYGENTRISNVYNHNDIYYQKLSRACIVHLVIKKNNWSYVKTMSCSGSHLGITINIKNTKFVGRSSVFYADRKSKMAATTGHSINTEPYGENTEIYMYRCSLCSL
jgi:hypothetical protein